MGKKQEKKIGPLTKEEHEKKLAKRAAKKAARKAKKQGVTKSVKALGPIAKKPALVLEKAPFAVGGKGRSYFNVKPMAGSGGTGVRIRGCDFLTTITVPQNTGVGVTMFNFAMNPTGMAGTRLATMAGLFDKYRFNRFVVRCVPCNGANVGGSYGMAYDRDPTDATPVSGDEGLRQFMAMPGTAIATQWLPLDLNCPILDPETSFFTNTVTGADERLVDQGQIYWFTVSQNVSSALNFFIEIEYDISMWIPEISPTLMTGNAALQANPNELISVPNTANSLLNILETGAVVGWNPGVFLGALRSGLQVGAVPAGLFGNGANWGVRLPPGIWTVAQQLFGTGATILGWGTSAGFAQPVVQAIDTREQEDITVINTNNFPTPSTQAVTGTTMISRTDEIYVPPNGGWLMCGQEACTELDTNGGKPLSKYNIAINPSRNSGILSVMLSKTKKFREPHLIEAKALAKEAEKMIKDDIAKERERAQQANVGAAPGGVQAAALPQSPSIQYANSSPQFRK